MVVILTLTCQCPLNPLRLDRSIKTFRDYAEKKVVPFIDKHLATTNMLMSLGQPESAEEHECDRDYLAMGME